MRQSATEDAIALLAKARATAPAGFDAVARALSVGLQCRWAGVGLRSDDGASVELIAYRAIGRKAALLKFPLDGSPCAEIYRADTPPPRCRYAGDLASRFPGDPTLAGNDIGFYCAEAYHDDAGVPIGHVFVMETSVKPDNPEFRLFLSLISQRVGADVNRWRAEDALRRSEERYRRLVETTNVIAWELDLATWRFTYVSPQAVEILGYPLAEWYTEGFWPRHLHPDDRDRAVKYCAAATDRGEDHDFEYRMIAADGRPVWIRDIVTVHSDAEGPCLLGGYMIDISAYKESEIALVQSEQCFKDFAEAATDYFWEMDENLRFSYFSERFEEVTGVPPEKLLGKTRRELLERSDTVIDSDTTEQMWRNHLADLEAHRPFQNFRHPRPNPKGGYFYLSISGKPVFDETGTFKGYRGSGSDITEQVRTEMALRESEAQLRLQSERAEEASRAKSEFLASMSHEIRTPLNAILGFSDSMRQQILGPLGSEKYVEYATAIHASGQHLLELVTDILDLAKIESGRYTLSRELFDLRTVIDECVQITRETMRRKGITLTVEMPDHLAPLFAEQRALKQILLNLLSNAVKFTTEGGSVIVDVTAQEDAVTLSVSDTGIGIPEDEIATLTEAFVQGRTDQAYLTNEGTGLGLAITDSLVKLHGGTMTIASTVGEGTTVRIHLPGAVSQQAEKAQETG